MEPSINAETVQWTQNRVNDAQKILLELQKSMEERGEKASVSSVMATLITTIDIIMEATVITCKDPVIAEAAIKAIEHSILNGINHWREELEKRKEKHN